MKIIMTTHNREPSYVSQTLESMFRNDDTFQKVHVLLHDNDTSQLGEWEQSSKVELHYMAPEDMNAKNRLARRAKSAHVKHMALKIAGDDECLVVEDDAVFVPRWHYRLNYALEQFGPNRAWCVISFCHYLDTDEIGLVPWNPATFFGSVCLFYGKVIAKTACEAFIRPHSPAWDTVNPGVGADTRLQALLKQRQKDFKLFAHCPALAWHVGQVSSIGSRREGMRRRVKPQP